MFKFARENIVEWPVNICYPVDGGSTREAKIKITYKLLKRDDAREMLQDKPKVESDAYSILKSHIKGWDGISDEDGNPLEFNDDNLESLLQVPYIEKPIVSGLIEASTGAPSKN